MILAVNIILLDLDKNSDNSESLDSDIPSVNDTSQNRFSSTST